MNVIAGIVTYNPQIQRLKENIYAVAGQVDEVVIYDNNSENIAEIEAFTKTCSRVILLRNRKNLGIASAFNYIIQYCSEKRTEWALLLDQDSVCPAHLIDQYKKYTHLPKTAIITPLVIDKRRAARNLKLKNDLQEVRNCVSSGSFVNVEICRQLGCFEDRLFIDVVDYEYCMRVRLSGYKIIRVNTLILDQEFGNVIRSKHSDIFLKLGQKIAFFNHMAYFPVYSPQRVRFTIRNWVYCIRKYKKYSHTLKEIGKLVKGILIIIVRGKFRIRLFISIMNGIRSGMAMEVNPVRMNQKQGHAVIELM